MKNPVTASTLYGGQKTRVAMKVELTNSQVELLHHNGAIVRLGQKDVYTFLPCWFKHISGNQYEMINFEDLPEEAKDLVEFVQKNRNQISKIGPLQEDFEKDLIDAAKNLGK